MLGTPQMAGSSIAYIDRPSFTQAYSPENLPEFMKDFEQISPTLFAPSQGVFGQAPEVDTIQPLMPQQYVDEYADLERAFQESIAVDPTMFGDMYRGGLYMPMQTLPSAPEDEPFDLAGSLAAAEALRQIYPIAEEPLGEVEEAIKRGVVDPTEEFIQQKMLDPTEDAFKAVADPVEEFVQQYALDPTEDVAKIILDPVEEVIQQAVLDPVEDIVKIPLKAIEKVIPEIDVNVEFKEPEPAVQIPTEDIENIVKDLAVEPIQNIVEQGVFDPIEDVIKIPAEIAQEQIISPIQDILPEIDINIEPIPEPVVAPEPEPIVEAVPQPEVTIPTEAIDKIISEAVIDPIKEITEPQLEAVKDFVVDPILESIPEIDIDVKGKTVSEIIDNLIIEEPKVVEEQVQKIAEEQVKELEDAGFIEFEDGKIDINITLPKVGEVPFIDTVEKVMESLPSDLPELVESYGDIENAIENPSAENVDKAVQAINDIGFDAGATAPVVPPAVGEGLSVVADIDAIIDAFENPDAESLTNAYAAADGLAATYTEAGGLPAGEAIGQVGTIFTGLEALDGGIESAADAVNVVNAANAVASMAGATTTSAAGVTAGFLPPNVTAALGPISMILSAPSIMKSISSLAKGGAAGTYERIQGEFDLKDGKFAVGGGVRGADTNRSFGDKYAQETMNSGVSMANSLVDDYGFEIDQQALNAAPENIMRLQTSGYYNREGRAQYGSSVGSADFVVKLLQNGVLKPTENTPPEILASNEAFASFVTDHIDKGQDEYAAKMYTDTGGTGAEFGNRTRTGTTIKQRAKFATQDAAQSWVNDNETSASYSKERAGKYYGYYKNQTLFDVVPVEVGDKTYYELKKNNVKKRISRAAYDEATKPKPKPAPKPEPVANDFVDLDDYFSNLFKGIDFTNINLGGLF
jgi:hypothetical protein